MAHRYDAGTNLFSPEGRLYQVEYAIETVNHAGTCLGILANDGILLAAVRRNSHKLLDEALSQKIYILNQDIVCSVAGLISDSNVLTNESRMMAQRYLRQHGEPIPCEVLVSWLCEIKQAHTQFEGKRPFGVSILYMGWDKYNGYQLYESDPTGNYTGWKAVCIGNNKAAAMSVLEQEYKEGDMTLENAHTLAISVLSKTLGRANLTSEKLEMASLRRISGATVIHTLSRMEVGNLIEDSVKSGVSEE